MHIAHENVRPVFLPAYWLHNYYRFNYYGVTRHTVKTLIIVNFTHFKTAAIMAWHTQTNVLQQSQSSV